MDYPKFYEIDSLLVVITQKDDELFGMSVPLGKSYPPFKAMNEGEELGRTEFMEKLKAQYPDSKMASLF